MNTATFTPRFWTITALVAIGIATRFLPHPPNFTAIAAIGLLAGAKLNSRMWSFVIPLLAMFVSDSIIGFHSTLTPVYICLAITVLMGSAIRNNQKAANIAAVTIGASAMFYLLTNLAVWLVDGMYPFTMSGLITCYTVAIPFFKNTLMGDLFYSGVLFGSFYFLERTVPSLAK